MTIGNIIIVYHSLYVSVNEKKESLTELVSHNWFANLAKIIQLN